MSDERATREVLTELLTVEARMAALGQHGAHLRSILQERAETEYREQGIAPTWRAAGLGTVTLPIRKPVIRVADHETFDSWAAQRFTDNVRAVVTLECSPAQLEDIIEHLELLRDDLAWPSPTVALEPKAAWLAEFLSGVEVIVTPDGDEFFAPETGESVPGLAVSSGGPSSVSVRLDKEAKARAAAEAVTPESAAVLLAPITEAAS